jgi:F-type H+-transporting ATPase subunit b
MIIDWFTVIAQTINFLILVALLKYFLYRPILNALDKREKAIAAAVTDAETSKLAAEQAQDVFNQKNAAFEQEKVALLNQAVNEAKAERQNLIAAARQEAEALRDQWQQGLINDYQNLGNDLTRRIQNEVFAITRKLLADLADESLEAKMVALFVQRLQNLAPEESAALKAAFKSSLHELQLRTRYPLTSEQQALLEQSVQSLLGSSQSLTFVQAPELVSGLELSSQDYRLAWHSADYLATLEKGVGTLLHQHLKAASVVIVEQGNHEQS